MIRIPQIAAALLALAFTTQTHAQVGSNWAPSNPNQYIHSQQNNQDQNSSYISSDQMARNTWLSEDRFHYHTTAKNGDNWPAEYDYNAELETEVFALYGNTTNTGNRCEVRVLDNYGPNQKRQLEGYVTFYAPLDSQSLLQIWGSENGASQMMLRGFDSSGSFSGGALAVERERAGTDSVAYLGNLYGKEVKINVVHIQNTSAGANNGKIQVYADGILLEEFTDDEDPQNGGLNNQNYLKYGIYQTITAGHENPVVVWKNVRLFDGGAVPGTGSQTISIPGNPTTINKTTSDLPFSLSATASSTLGVTYRSSNLAVAKVNGSNIEIVGPGTAVIWVNQGGNGSYKPAPSKKVTLNVTDAPTIVPPLYEAAYHTDLTTSTPRISCGTFSSASNALTVSFWVRADALGNMQPVDKLPATYSANNQGWAVKLRADGAIWFRVGAEDNYSDLRLSAATYQAGTWAHVTCTFDGSTQKVFINGTVPGNGTKTGVTGYKVTGSTDLSVGRPSVAATTNIFSGDLRDVRVYDRVLSNDEIGVLAIFPRWLMNGPVNFDGTAGDYMSGGTDPGSGTSLTVAFYADADSFANMQPVDKLPADATAPNGAAGGWSVKFRSNGDVWFRVGNETTNSTVKCAIGYIPTRKVHIACTFTGGVAKVYSDGVLLTDYANVGTIPYSTSNTNVELRLAVPQRAAITNIFAGNLERVRVFHQALTATQIGLLADGL